MSNRSLYHEAKYLTSAADLKQLPADTGWEVAFIGRSNAGKSSALNTITGIKGLARTSNTPGRTQMINFFSMDDERRLVDLPGYGYAKVPRNIKERWARNTNEYLETRQCLRGLVLVMDIRHPLKESDQHMIAWTASCGVPLHILLTKSDKLKNAATRKTLDSVRESLKLYSEDQLSVQVFSSHDRVGVEAVQDRLDEWFESE